MEILSFIFIWDLRVSLPLRLLETKFWVKSSAVLKWRRAILYVNNINLMMWPMKFSYYEWWCEPGVWKLWGRGGGCHRFQSFNRPRGETPEKWTGQNRPLQTSQGLLPPFSFSVRTHLQWNTSWAFYFKINLLLGDLSATPLIDRKFKHFC